jgi:zinc D-Ala-D-Ala carboxypeptidase
MRPLYSRYGGAVKALGLVSLLILSLGMSSCQSGQAEDQEGLTTVSEATTPVAPPVTSAPETRAPSPEPVEVATFDKTTHSLDEASSLWVIVNKHRPLEPLEYAPDGLVAVAVPGNYSPLLREDAALALEELFADATEDGVSLVVQSTYRSYSLQQRIKRASVERHGQEVSDGRSARAGYSEHQTGLAVDLTNPDGTCTLLECFADTEEGRWLAENSWRHGFVLRYLENASPTTGYVYEPWHFRFVGTELASEIWNQGYPTLEEFFGLPPAPDYRD